MIGIVILGSLRDPVWDWRLLYRVAGKTILEHTVASAMGVEVAHKIIVCLDYKDSAQVNGTAFNTAALDKTFIQTDERVNIHFSDKKDLVGKTYDACLRYNLTSVCIIKADDPLIPSWLIKECIMMHMNSGIPVRTAGYPTGIDASVLPFHMIANMYRYREFKEQQDRYVEQIVWKDISNTNDGSYHIYDGIKDLRFSTKSDIAMLDALLTDIAGGEELSDLLKEWHEQ